MNYIQGTVKLIVFHSDENSYSIIKISVTESTEELNLFLADDSDYITVTGYFPLPMRGEEIRFFGEFKDHPRYGVQYSVRSYEKVSDTSIAGLIEYLASDLFKGVGLKTAMNVVNTLGKDTIQLILNDKTVLDKVPKLSSKLQDVIYDSILANKAAESTLIQLYSFEITPKTAMKIFQKYQNEAMAIIKQNPYQLIYDIDGIGFERADEIARKLGFLEDDPLRIKAMIMYLFNYMGLNYGHTFLYNDQLRDFLIKGLNKNKDLVTDSDIQYYIDEMIKERTFHVEDDKITLGSIVYAEHQIINKVKELSEQVNDIDSKKVDDLIALFENINNITYTKLQKKAIHNALSTNLFILTGGPGTGKTTVIKGIVFVYAKYFQLPILYDNPLFDIKLIAPTGRAAKRMTETTNLHAETIHRFLGYSFDGKFMFDKDNLVNAKMIIIDEASMIDIFLASQLFQSIPKDTKVVVVGDEDQLPSVGPGQLLKDLIDSDMIDYIKLNTIHRQAENSNIVKLAYNVNEATLPSNILKTFDDRYFVTEDVKTFDSRLINVIDYLMSLGYDLIEDIQILAPMYKGTVGIDHINQVIQKQYNPNTSKVIEHIDRKFMIGDKVIQLTNQAEDNIMNGDQGVVAGIVEDGIVVEFQSNTVNYKRGDLIHLKHAYAMSIHKSQGSEYKVVIMPVFNQYYIMLKRKLLYTGITRAKEKLILMGDVNALKYGIEHLEEARQSMLKDKIINHILKQPEPVKNKRILINDPGSAFSYIGEEFSQELSPYDFLNNRN